MSSKRWILALVVAAFAAACSLVVPLDDLGGSDSATNDAGGDAADAPSDVATDGSPCVGFCACQSSPHALCQDFDGDGGLVGPFDSISTGGDASASLDTTRFKSSPRSATFKYVGMDAGTQFAVLAYTILETASKMTVDAKMFIPARPPGGGYETIDFVFPNGNEIDYVIGPNSEFIAVDCFAPCVQQFDASSGLAAYKLNLALAPNKWVDVKFDVTLSPTFAVSVSYDGVLAGSVPANLYTAPPSQPQLYIGAAYANASPAFELGIDDVTYDWSP
jgi:hypothetical protein